MTEQIAQTEPQLLSLLSEKQGALRKKSEQVWNREGSVRISASEWLILSKMHKGSSSASQVARAADITRQAAHKYIHILEEKGLVCTTAAGDRRMRRLELTEFGAECWKNYQRLQVDLERQIADSLGNDCVKTLKALLGSSWFAE